MSARRVTAAPPSRRREAARRALALAAPVVAVLAGFAPWSLAPQGAEAHALLVRSDPPVNARLLDPPTSVTAFFSEALDSRLSSMQVLDGSGARVDTGETSFGPDATQIAIGVRVLAPGFYTVIWETLSSIDGHLLKGSFPFTVLNADGSEPSGPRFAGPATGGYSGGNPKWENVVTKWLGLLAAVAVLGSLAFVLWVVRPATAALDEPWRRRVREAARRHLAWLIWPGLAALALTGLAEVLLQARQLGGVGFLDDVLRNSWGERWIQRQLLLGAMLAAALVSGQLRRRGRGSLSEAALWVVLAAAFGYLLLVAMTSHGGSIPGSFWAVGADFVHLTASAVWIGMLAQLLLLLWWCRSYPSDAERAQVVSAHLQRFSTFAATSVVLLIASGAVNGLSQIPVPEAMLDTAYGRALTVKLCLMMALLAIAGVNAVYLRPRLTSGPTPSERLRPLLARTTTVEIGMAVIVLLVAAVLVQYPTARQVRAAAANVESSAQAVVGFEEVQPAGDVSVDLSIAPNRVGTNSYRIFLFPAGGGQIGEVQRVRLRFKPPDPTVGPSEIIAEQSGVNAYKAVGSFFAQPGRWEAQVDLRRAQVEDVTAIFRVDVTGAGAQAGGGRYAYPLEVGSWLGVGAVGALLAALLMAVWGIQWPSLPAPAPRLLRVGSTAIAVVALGVLFGVVWGLVPEKAASGNPIAPTGDSIAIGRSLFAANCATCHGPTGHGDGPQAPALEVPPADFRQHIPYHSDEFFFQVISNGLGTFMPPFAGQMSAEERWHLINFLKSEFGQNAEQAAQP